VYSENEKRKVSDIQNVDKLLLAGIAKPQSFFAHLHNNKDVEFTWERVRLFDYDACRAIFNFVVSNPIARIIDVKTKPKSKWRPTALDTIVMLLFFLFVLYSLS
jgi:hypothetical protein